MFRDRLGFLEETLDAQAAQLNAGLISQFEVIETENQALDARQSLYTNHLEILNASIELYKALGGGWGSTT